MKKSITIALLLLLCTFLSMGQSWINNITPKPPKTSKQNTAQLFGGLAMQALGVGIIAGSAYLIVLTPEDESYDIPLYGLSIGAGFAVVGGGLMIRSISNMVIARRSIHNMKKERKKNDVSLQFGPTQYGVGIVCKF